MKLFNSLSRKIETLQKSSGDPITFYSCGPTVYDRAHIGNFRTYVIEDTLRRVLRQSGYELNHIMNITDIDDKTIERSKKNYPDDEPSAALHKLTRHYEKLFLDDCESLGIDLSQTKLVRATEHINEMQQLIREIPNRYITEDGVYFDITKYDHYGVLVKIDRAHEHHRIQNDEYDKDHAADFALWKAAKEGEPLWDFDIDSQNIKGRPGWHIECSAMSTKYLGQPFDLHSGGVDLKFPHHENEIAQSRSVNGKQLAQSFVHIEHLLVEDRKMSKSLNNFYTLEDVIKRDFDPLALRLLLLQAHYRSQLNFSWETLTAAKYFIKNIQDNFSWIYQSGAVANEPLHELDQSLESFQKRIEEALSNDLNTPQALAILAEAGDGFAVTPASQLDIPTVEGFAKFIEQILGIPILDKARYQLPEQLKQVVASRDRARLDEKWEEADSLKRELQAKGLELLKDTPQGSIWYRL